MKLFLIILLTISNLAWSEGPQEVIFKLVGKKNYQCFDGAQLTVDRSGVYSKVSLQFLREKKTSKNEITLIKHRKPLIFLDRDEPLFSFDLEKKGDYQFFFADNRSGLLAFKYSSSGWVHDDYFHYDQLRLEVAMLEFKKDKLKLVRGYGDHFDLEQAPALPGLAHNQGCVYQRIQSQASSAK